MVEINLEYDEPPKKLKRTGWLDSTLVGIIGEGLTSEESINNAKTKMKEFLIENNYQIIVRPIINTLENKHGYYTCMEATLFRIIE